jgi:hypothetical protein
MDDVLGREGLTIERESGPAPHPVLAALARERQLYGRIVASLALPDEDGQRPVRRGGARGASGYYSQRPAGQASRESAPRGRDG